MGQKLLFTDAKLDNHPDLYFDIIHYFTCFIQFVTHFKYTCSPQLAVTLLRSSSVCIVSLGSYICSAEQAQFHLAVLFLSCFGNPLRKMPHRLTGTGLDQGQAPTNKTQRVQINCLQASS